MTVSELKFRLSELPPEMEFAEVILQKDDEGNGYRRLYHVDSEAVYIEGFGEPTVYDVDTSAEDNCLEEEEWEALKKGPRCVVLA